MIEVYGVQLDVDAGRRERWRAWLSSHELARAARYVDAVHGARYLAAHAQLRWLLAQRLGLAPEALRFERGPQGKPFLTGVPLRFSLSHCREYALVALHSTLEVGVDLEWPGAPRDWLALARRFFTSSESAWLADLPLDALPLAFCRLWTCKEAWMKADGRGLGAGLHTVEVRLSDSPRPELHGADGWRARELQGPAGFAAAVVWAHPRDAQAGGENDVSLRWPAPPE